MQLITVFAQEYFFKSSEYNSTKVLLFNLLYAGGEDVSEKDRYELLYDIITQHPVE